jgi:hypothetical protein
MRGPVTRLELAGIRVCQRCGRGTAELRGTDGASLLIGLDPVRARELAHGGAGDGLRSVADVVLEQLAASARRPSEVVVDVADGHLRALLSLVGTGEPEIITCTPQEGLALALRGALSLYATDEALAHAARAPQRQDRHGGAGGPNLLH